MCLRHVRSAKADAEEKTEMRHTPHDVFDGLVSIAAAIPIVALLTKESYATHPWLTVLAVASVAWYVCYHVMEIVVFEPLSTFLLRRRQRKWNERMEAFSRIIATCKWIAYDPINVWGEDTSEVTDAEVEAELNTLLNNGFDGLITFTSSGTCGHIAEIAKTKGGKRFRAVIAGITHVDNGAAARAEVENAIKASPWVDGYCVGHMCQQRHYFIDDVIKWIKRVRVRTQKPVTTTLRPNGYDHKIGEAVDWFFPDIHWAWNDCANADRAMQDTKQLISKMELMHNVTGYHDKPLLYKMVCFPAGIAKHADEDEQARFYQLLRKYLRDDDEMTGSISLSYFSAFDTKWKEDCPYFAAGDAALGLFSNDLRPRKAVEELHAGGRRQVACPLSQQHAFTRRRKCNAKNKNACYYIRIIFACRTCTCGPRNRVCLIRRYGFTPG